MKAIICNEFAPLEDLVYGEAADPEATGDSIVIKPEAIGVNYPDGLLVQGKYQMRPERPFIPGMEAAGVVESVGPDVKNFKVGDRVAKLCSLAGYAEKVHCTEDRTYPLPEGMDAADACALLCAYGTSHHALKQRGQLKPGEKLVVLGAAGATGVAAVQSGKAMGAHVFGVASSDAKREIAKNAGADEVIGYENLKDNLKAMTDGKGVDVVFDPVGGEAFDAATRCMARNGRLLVIGFASGTVPTFPVNLSLVKEYSVVGVFWGSFTRHQPADYAQNMEELIAWYQGGQIKPVIEGRYPLADAADVLKRVLDRGATGKIVLVP